MKVKIKKLTDWDSVKSAALQTIGKKYSGSEITEKWKKQILLAEHSPIRILMFEITMEDIPSYVSVHLVRHKHGIEHFVTTQRDDRTNNVILREDKPQGAPVTHRMVLNAQALINISRKRLCSKADKMTRIAWTIVIKELSSIEPTLADICVYECIYRGFCPEFNGCGFDKTKDFENILKQYRG